MTDGLPQFVRLEARVVVAAETAAAAVVAAAAERAAAAVTARVAAVARSRLRTGRRSDRVAVLVDLHAEAQPHRGQDFLDLVERLAAEVLGLEHFRFGLLHQFSDGLDI